MNELWAALIGALVGGAISGVTSWLTARGQWKREQAEKQLDRAYNAVSDLSGLLSAHLWDLQRAEPNEERLGRFFQGLIVAAPKVKPTSAHLAGVLGDAMDELEEEIELLSDTKSGAFTRHERGAWALVAVLMAWTHDPAQFEREKKPFSSFMDD